MIPVKNSLKLKLVKATALGKLDAPKEEVYLGPRWISLNLRS